jgi:hypothetical protein
MLRTYKRHINKTSENAFRFGYILSTLLLFPELKYKHKNILLLFVFLFMVVEILMVFYSNTNSILQRECRIEYLLNPDIRFLLLLIPFLIYSTLLFIVFLSIKNNLKTNELYFFLLIFGVVSSLFFTSVNYIFYTYNNNSFIISEDIFSYNKKNHQKFVTKTLREIENDIKSLNEIFDWLKTNNKSLLTYLDDPFGEDAHGRRTITRSRLYSISNKNYQLLLREGIGPSQYREYSILRKNKKIISADDHFNWEIFNGDPFELFKYPEQQIRIIDIFIKKKINEFKYTTQKLRETYHIPFYYFVFEGFQNMLGDNATNIRPSSTHTYISTTLFNLWRYIYFAIIIATVTSKAKNLNMFKNYKS